MGGSPISQQRGPLPRQHVDAPFCGRLIVNLRHYDSEDADSDDPTAMRLAFHFEGGTIVLNSQLDDSWGEVQTEDFAEQRPFGAGRDFKVSPHTHTPSSTQHRQI